jgi:predicted small metal-binding protein
MTYKLACKDMGVMCPFVAEGETMEEMMELAVKHAKEEHGYTDEQLNDPETQKAIKAAIKEE